MCRMIGIVGDNSGLLHEALNGFFTLCTDGKVKCNMTPGHTDGWGLSGFSVGRAVYFGRRMESAVEGRDLFSKAVGKAEITHSPVVIGHLRKASQGAKTIHNTHPFHFNDWVFCHNGDIYNVKTLPMIDGKPTGQTDSERFMVWMVDHTRNAMDVHTAISNLIKEWRDQLTYSSLTFLLSDGKRLWAYREVGSYNLQAGETLEDRQSYYTLYWTNLNGIFVVCSEPLPGISPEWNPIGQREIAVFTPGQPQPLIEKI